MPRPPESLRTLTLGSEPVSYRLRRSARRTIGLAIDARGLRVAAPHRARQADIDALLHQHADWVLTKLAAWRARPVPVPLAWEDGDCIDILGQPHTLCADPARRRGHALDAAAAILSVAPVPSLDIAVARALQVEGRRLFAERLAHFAPLLGVALPSLRLSSARTRWGSCSARGSVSLNWRLIHLPLTLIDYVVIHELAHLKEMNHSPRFWAWVASVCPDWQARRNALRQRGTLLAG